MKKFSKRSSRNPAKSDVLKIGKLIRNSARFLVTAHSNPEGDAIGSTLAVFNYLKGLKKNVTAYNKDGVPRNLAYLENAGLLKDVVPDGNFDVTFILDCSEFDRVAPDFGSLKERLGIIINIDHHITSKGAGEINIIDPEASSTAEVIFEILKILKAGITKGIAEALYTALLTDTGSFRYSNSTAKAFKTAAELIGTGVDPWKVASKAYEEMPVERLKLIAMVLSSLDFLPGEKIASVLLTRKMLKDTGALPEFSDGLINYPRSIEGVEVAILFKEASAGEYRISFRSKGKIDVAKVASEFGGGGHRNASGCTVTGTLESVKERIYASTKEAIRSKIGPDTAE